MQVGMIQSMLPYSAWLMRVASLTDHDFITARRAIANGSLDWASKVECIFKVLHNNNALSSPLTTFAKLTAINSETTLDFTRRLRQVFFFLPADMVVGPQARDILSQHVRQFLPQTWSTNSSRARPFQTKNWLTTLSNLLKPLPVGRLNIPTFSPVPVRQIQLLNHPHLH